MIKRWFWLGFCVVPSLAFAQPTDQLGAQNNALTVAPTLEVLQPATPAKLQGADAASNGLVASSDPNSLQQSSSADQAKKLLASDADGPSMRLGNRTVSSQLALPLGISSAVLLLGSGLLFWRFRSTWTKAS